MFYITEGLAYSFLLATFFSSKEEKVKEIKDAWILSMQFPRKKKKAIRKALLFKLALLNYMII